MTLPVTLHLGRSDRCAYAPRTINNGGEKRERESLSYITRSEIDLGIGERDSSQIYTRPSSLPRCESIDLLQQRAVLLVTLQKLNNF